MMLCDFAYVADEGGYSAVCRVCNRQAKTKTTKAIAACRAGKSRPSPELLMQAAGIVAAKPAATGGPGTELKAILADWLGIVPAEGCACNSMAARMDALGPEWCEGDEGMAEILGVMRAEHGKRWEAGETKLPWTDFGAKQLVRLACRRARAKASA